MSDAGADVSQLRAALDAANRAAATERAARIQAETRVRGAEGNQFAAREQAADAAIAATQTEIEGLVSQQEALFAEGKFAEASRLTVKIADATSRQREAQTHKTYFAQQREQASRAPTDPLANFSPAQRSWIEQHPAYLSDPNYANRVNFLYEKGKQEAGLAQDSPELFAYIEQNLNPKSATTSEGGAKPASQARADGGGAAEGGDSPFSETGDTTEAEPPGEGGASGLQRHTMDAAPVNQTTDPPAMRIEIDTGEKPSSEQTPQPKAAKGDGQAIRSVAAPPSRNISQFVQRTNRTGRIEPTMEELAAARDLASVIEPEIAQKGDVEIIKWYYAMAHAPSNSSTRRRSWARDAVVS